MQYLHGFPGVKEYRTRLVHTESLDDVFAVTNEIRQNHTDLIEKILEPAQETAFTEAWNQCNG